MGARLGIAGTPPDFPAIMETAVALGITPVFLVEPSAPGNGLPPDAASLELGEDPRATLAASSLDGIYVADGCQPTWLRGGWPADLGVPGVTCVDTEPGEVCPLSGAQLYTVGALQQRLQRGGPDISVPAWVRASCGDGDASCMRVDHPSDISLALQKVRKRNPDGLLRIQPALPGDVYRVVAFKAGAALLPVAYMEETVTPSVYRVPLGVTLPLPADSEAVAQMDDALTRLNGRLPEGWGYCEFEFVATEAGVVLTDMQAPVRLGREPRRVVLQALGVDLLRCALECALGRVPDVTPRRAQAVAFSWLLTRSGVVTEVTGVSAARALPGVVDVVIQAREGDVLTHVVDRASRERGGYILAEGDSLDRAWAALEQAREAVWIQTSPALS